MSVLVCFILFQTGVLDDFDDCDQYELTTDADVEAEDDNILVPSKRHQKRKVDRDFLHPSEGMKSMGRCLRHAQSNAKLLNFPALFRTFCVLWLHY